MGNGWMLLLEVDKKEIFPSFPEVKS